MKISEVIDQLQFLKDNYGDVDVTIPEYVEENTSTEYHKYLKHNRVRLLEIGEDTDCCLCVSVKI